MSEIIILIPLNRVLLGTLGTATLSIKVRLLDQLILLIVFLLFFVLSIAYYLIVKKKEYEIHKEVEEQTRMSEAIIQIAGIEDNEIVLEENEYDIVKIDF